MSKNIILLSDGTGNSNLKDRGTNVFKLYEAIDFNKICADPKEQIAFYDDGVGTEKLKPLKILGGAFGLGLAKNIRELYKHLVEVYTPGDRIFLFGFSRGAFTVRSLAGLIANMGILKASAYPNDDDLENAVFHLYEDYRAKNTAILERYTYDPLIKLFFKAQKTSEPCTYTDEELNLNGQKLIEFIGVWDTVDAVGLPFDVATDLWNKCIFRFKFTDFSLHQDVNKACHALSIDDERQSFRPVLWKNDERINQVWFSGVHANVGGGYPQQGLSLVALDWMMGKARVAGLQFVPNDEEFVRDRKYALDKLYNSRSGVGVYYQYKPRNIAQLSTENGIGINKPQIHISAFERVANDVFGYAPRTFPSDFEVIGNDGNIHPNSAAIQAIVNSAVTPLPLKSPLLDQTAAYICNRRTIYYIFLSYTVFALLWLLRDDIKGKGLFSGIKAAIKTLVDPDSLLEKLASLFWHNSWLTIGGMLIFSCAVYVRLKMSAVISKFWASRRDRIKHLV